MRNILTIFAVTLTACSTAAATGSGSVESTSLAGGQEIVDCLGSFPVAIDIPQPGVWQVEACDVIEGASYCEDVTGGRDIVDGTITLDGCASDYIRVTWVHLK